MEINLYHNDKHQLTILEAYNSLEYDRGIKGLMQKIKDKIAKASSNEVTINIYMEEESDD